MKTNMKQLRIEEWQKVLRRIHDSEPGQIQIAYADENGNKRIGYIDLFDIEIEHEGNKTTVGGLFHDLFTAQAGLANELAKTNDDLATTREQVANLAQAVLLLKSNFDRLSAELESVKIDIYPDTAHL